MEWVLTDSLGSFPRESGVAENFLQKTSCPLGNPLGKPLRMMCVAENFLSLGKPALGNLSCSESGCAALCFFILSESVENRGPPTRRPKGIGLDARRRWLHFCATMRIATVRDLRNHYKSVLRWISAGEDVLITQRGVVIARLSPESAQTAQVIDWASSPEVLRDRSGDPVLSAEQSAEILAEAGGRW